MITDYATLQTEVANWLNRADLTAQIPVLIQMAEAHLNRTMRTNDMIQRETSEVTSGYISMPTDWVQTVTLLTLATPPVVLEYVRAEDLNNVRAAQATGDPCVYTILNKKFYMFPEPQAALDVEMVYYAKIPDLATNDTNWMLDEHPDIYLLGSLLQAEVFLKGDDRLPVWASLYKVATESLTTASEHAKRPDGGFNARRRTFG